MGHIVLEKSHSGEHPVWSMYPIQCGRSLQQFCWSRKHCKPSMTDKAGHKISLVVLLLIQLLQHASVIHVTLNFRVRGIEKNLNFKFWMNCSQPFLFCQDTVFAFHFFSPQDSILSVTPYEEIDHVSWKSCLTKRHVNWPRRF